MSTVDTKITPMLESNFKFQVSKLDSCKHYRVHTEVKFPSITISREFGCNGNNMAHELAELLSKHGVGWNNFNIDVNKQISDSAEFTEKLLEVNEAERRNQLQQYHDQLHVHTPITYRLSTSGSSQLATSRKKHITIW